MEPAILQRLTALVHRMLNFLVQVVKTRPENFQRQQI